MRHYSKGLFTFEYSSLFMICKIVGIYNNEFQIILSMATVCNGCSEVGELRQKLMDHQTRLIEAETKMNQLKQDLSFTQTKLNLAEQQLLATETELEKKTTSCASLCKRVEDEVKKHHEIRNSR